MPSVVPSSSTLLFYDGLMSRWRGVLMIKRGPLILNLYNIFY